LTPSVFANAKDDHVNTMAAVLR